MSGATGATRWWWYGSSSRGTSDAGPTAAMADAMAVSTGAMIWAPLASYTLYPLSWGGLCEAVITTAAVASRWRAA